MLKLAIRAAAITIGLSLATGSSPAQAGAADTYKSKCVACHGPDGLGNTPVGKAMGVKAYNAPDVLKLSNADLTTIIKNGKNNMPSFTGKLTDSQIKDLLTYIHTLQK
jgi:mono/diheme cytochrome c family protein